MKNKEKQSVRRACAGRAQWRSAREHNSAEWTTGVHKTGLSRRQVERRRAETRAMNWGPRRRLNTLKSLIHTLENDYDSTMNWIIERDEDGQPLRMFWAGPGPSPTAEARE